MNDPTRRKLLGVERVPHLGIRHFKNRSGSRGKWLLQYPSEAARLKFNLPPNLPRVVGANAGKRARAEKLAHRRRFSQLDRVLPREE